MEYLETPRVYWNLTSKCNINPPCEYCYQESTPYKEEYVKNLKEKYKILDHLYDAGIRLLGLGGGEPTLDKHLPYLINYASEKRMVTQMVSNGTKINKKLAKKLKEVGLKQIGINLDSVSPAIHNSFRGNRNYWEKAYMGVLNCLDANLNTGIVMTVSKRNFHEIEKFIQFGTEIGVDEVEFVNLVPVGRGSSMLDEILRKDQIRELFKICSKYSFKEKPRINVGDSQFYLCLQKYSDNNRLGKDIPLGCGCAAGISTCALQPDLTITPCLLMPKLIAGDLKEKSFREIWTDSQIFKRLRDRDNLEGMCGKCDNKENCGGCRAMAYAITENFMAGNPFCVMNTN